MSAAYMVAMLIASTIAWEFNCVEGFTSKGPHVTCEAYGEPIVLCAGDKCRAADGYEYDVNEVMAALQ